MYRSAIIACGNIARVHARAWQTVEVPWHDAFYFCGT